MSYAVIVSAVAAAAVGAYSSYESGQQQKALGESQNEWNQYQANQAIADANAEKSSAELHAEMIRKMAKRQASEANASLAGSGVEVGEGTAVNINKDIYANAEEDAMLTIFGGVDRSKRGINQAAGYRATGEQAQISGNAAARAGTLNAASSILGGVSTVAKGWKTGTNATTTAAGGNTTPGYSRNDLGSGLRVG
ncbi:MAG: hypothetical protein E6R09_06820 [Rhodocyclaceae bacterium]|nr:MAG: hypothetical protein E6R09_06820 [Rhodocyclaceae bacterium]